MQAEDKEMGVSFFLKKDYGRLTGSGRKVGLLKIYFHTFRSATFGTIFIYRVLSNSLNNKIKFHFLWLIMRFIVPHRKDIELNVQAQIGEGLVIYHGSGLVVGSGVSAGKNLTLEHGVTLGNRIGSSSNDAGSWPVLGDNCFIGCGAALLGPVRIGNNVKIGANAVVICNVPDDCTAVGVPARIISPKKASRDV